MVRSPGGLDSVEFDLALASLRQERFRPEITIDEAPAPQRLAPHAVALTAEILDPADSEADAIATGRLVVLHDPEGVDSWAGTFRVVSYARADLEADLAGDHLLTSVGWSWLQDALAEEGAAHHSLGGTVTRVFSEGFGSLVDSGANGQIEIRASWTPDGPPEDLGRHARAWACVLSSAAGLIPEAAGVTRLGRPSTPQPGVMTTSP